MRRRVAARANRRFESPATHLATPKLSVVSSHDPLEREADQISQAVASGSRLDPASATFRSGSPSLLRAKAAGARQEGAVAPDIETGIASQTQRGEALKPAARQFFERRFGTGFKGVRIHADASANRLASSLGAHAFTCGEHVFFGPGQGAGSGSADRRLMAHELTHVAQQRGQSTAQAAGGGFILREVAEPLDLEQGDVAVRLSIGISESPSGGLEVKADGNGVVDLTDREVLPGDVFSVFARGKSRGRFTWSMPPEFETLKPDLHTSGIQLRVDDTLQLAGQDKVVEATLESALTKVQLRVRLRIAAVPQSADVVNPELAANEEATSQLAEDRKSSRQSFRTARGERREQFRSGTRQERREGRSQFRKERRQARIGRRKERRSERRRAAKLRQERRQLKKEQGCHFETQKEIQAAIEQGIQAVGTAIGKLNGAGVQDPQVANSLHRYMKWLPDPGEASNEARLAGIVNMLTSAKNSMLSSKDSVFQCGSFGCDENTGAFVKAGSQRGDEVFICTQWLRGTFKSPVASGRDEGRAYALLHEFVHLAGAQESPERYLHSGWDSLTFQQAIKQADGYAALAWTLR